MEEKDDEFIDEFMSLLEENNVITIEPGIYIAGWGGVRIEDDCIIKKDSCQPMNKSSKELIVVT